EAAAVAAAHRTLIALFPKQRPTFDLIAARCWADMPRGAEYDAGAALGRFVAERMLEARCNDGSDQIGQYTPKTAPGLWRPTAPFYRDALLPEWGYVKPFAIKKGTQHRPAGPPALTSLQYGAAFNEVKHLGGKHSHARTEEQTQIAHFW